MFTFKESILNRHGLSFSCPTVKEDIKFAIEQIKIAPCEEEQRGIKQLYLAQLNWILDELEE